MDQAYVLTEKIQQIDLNFCFDMTVQKIDLNLCFDKGIQPDQYLQVTFHVFFKSNLLFDRKNPEN